MYGPQSDDYKKASQKSDEIRRLKMELNRVADERDRLKKPRRTSQATLSEIRLYQRARRELHDSIALPVVRSSPEWLLRLTSGQPSDI